MTRAEGDPRPAGRRAVQGLLTPHPFGERLPGPYAEDDFAQRFVSAFDEVLAPVFSVLDCLDAYWDPRLAPEDFLGWLAGWVAADVGERQSLAERREAVAGAVRAHRLRGTARGLAEQVGAVLGLPAEVAESGAAAWSATPGGELPGEPEPALRLRIRTADPAAVPARALAALIDANRPAHVPCTVDVQATDEVDEPGTDRGRTEDGSSADV
ncbi:phage tail-like protein [Kitasatospora sp. MAA4]|uniref:phage tail protein n=1 Tax=Kitasatospora sp. MAA4 TaxID=3035093 RepID=UPI00247563C3|nr:phage tail protein [Kitasatospora sp. MAA4]MDH6137749.1 phage tail-like protein [Kitasatospora sp. MAA4]